MYNLIINGKKYQASYADTYKVTIPLHDVNDIYFFHEWQTSQKTVKIDYIRDVRFIKVTEEGILKHCFCVLDENETSVDIFYDYKVTKK